MSFNFTLIFSIFKKRLLNLIEHLLNPRIKICWGEKFLREKNRESKLKFDIAIKPSRICINVDRTNCSFSLLFLIYAENYGKRKVCRAEHGKDKFISRRRVCSELNKLLLASKVNKNIFN